MFSPIHTKQEDTKIAWDTFDKGDSHFKAELQNGVRFKVQVRVSLSTR